MSSLIITTRRALAVLLLTAFFLPAGALAQGYVTLETPGNLGSCGIVPSTGIVEVAVMHYPLPAGAVLVTFSVAIPPCLPGASWLGDDWNFPAIGNAIDGVAVSYDGVCQTGPVHVGNIRFFVPSVTSCCEMQVYASPNSISGEVEEAGCDAVVRAIGGRYGVLSPDGEVCAGIEPPSSPIPADGATDVALDADLSWTEGEAHYNCDVPEVSHGYMYFGTDPDSLIQLGSDVFPPFDPGPLEIGKTYYWRVDYYYLGTTVGPLWQFTATLQPTPVETTTWGRVKALYD